MHMIGDLFTKNNNGENKYVIYYTNKIFIGYRTKYTLIKKLFFLIIFLT